MYPKHSRGQTVLSVVMWATGISIAVGGTVYGRVAAKFDDQSKINIQVESRTTKVETKLELMDDKIDLLLKANGINPSYVR